MEEKIYVLLSYTDDDDEVGCKAFKTKQALLDYLKDEIRRWKNDYFEDYDVNEEIAEMEKSMNENGWWNAGDGLEFVLKEKELIG
jgi:hypothetical protein